MRFAKIACGRRDDRALGDDQFLSRLNRESHILFGDEVQRQRSIGEQSATSKVDRITQLSHALEQAQREQRLVEVQRVTLLARLSKAWLPTNPELDAGDCKVPIVTAL